MLMLSLLLCQSVPAPKDIQDQGSALLLLLVCFVRVHRKFHRNLWRTEWDGDWWADSPLHHVRWVAKGAKEQARKRERQ